MTGTAEGPSDAWAAFEARLAKALASMEHATYLVVSLASEPRTIASAYVQFAQGGLLGFRAEAAGNRWLPPGHGPRAAQEEKLAKLGWQRPETAPQGRNCVREWEEPVPFVDVAAMAVQTLREVYGAMTPEDLTYRNGGFPTHHGLVVDPELGIPRDRPASDAPAAAVVGARTHPAPEPDEAVASLEAALSEFVSGADLVPDRDGDLPIRVGSALMFVRPVPGRPPLLQLFSPLVSGVDMTPALLESLNEINRNILFGRVFWADRDIVVSMELTAVGISAQQIAFGCVQLGNLADHLDDVLRGRFGGRTVFEVPKTLVN
jgi:Putative bacterial sensory transduction regulator